MPMSRKRVLARHGAPVSRAAWTHDGRYLITCGHDKTLRLWNPLRAEADPDTGGPVLWHGDGGGGGAANEGLELALQIKEYVSGGNAPKELLKRCEMKIFKRFLRFYL